MLIYNAGAQLVDNASAYFLVGSSLVCDAAIDGHVFFRVLLGRWDGQVYRGILQFHFRFRCVDLWSRGLRGIISTNFSLLLQSILQEIIQYLLVHGVGSLCRTLLLRFLLWIDELGGHRVFRLRLLELFLLLICLCLPHGLLEELGWNQLMPLGSLIMYAFGGSLFNLAFEPCLFHEVYMQQSQENRLYFRFRVGYAGDNPQLLTWETVRIGGFDRGSINEDYKTVLCLFD